LLKAIGDLRAERDRRHEELGEIALPLFEIAGRADGADAGGAVGERNEPEPSVIEPEDADIALGLSEQPARTAEVTEDRRAFMPPVALLEAELIGEQRVASARVDEEIGAPAAHLASLVAGGDLGAALRGKRYLRHPHAFEDDGPFGGGILQQEMIEL